MSVLFLENMICWGRQFPMEFNRSDHRQVNVSTRGLQYQDLISAVVEGSALASMTLSIPHLKKSLLIFFWRQSIHAPNLLLGH